MQNESKYQDRAEAVENILRTVGSLGQAAIGWRGQDASSAAELLEQLLVAREELEAAGQAVVNVMRSEGASWADIAAVTKTSRQAAQQRFGRSASL